MSSASNVVTFTIVWISYYMMINDVENNQTTFQLCTFQLESSKDINELHIINIDCALNSLLKI